MPNLLPALYVFTNIVQNITSQPILDPNLKSFENLHKHDVPHGQHEFVVSVITIERPVVTRHCTGSLLHKNWVLSSAHCFVVSPQKEFHVWYDNFTMSPLYSNMYSKVLKIYIHPDFNHSQFSYPSFFFGDNDISLLRVAKVSKWNYGQLSTVHYTKMYGLPVTYIGGANKLRRTVEEFPQLQYAEGIIGKCGSARTLWSKYVLCVAPKCTERTHHPLHGDDGGPFLYNGKIIGLMTTNFQMAKTPVQSTGVTPISPYKKWIKQVVTERRRQLLRTIDALELQ